MEYGSEKPSDAGSNNDTPAAGASTEVPVTAVCHELRVNDVVMGRGAFSIRNEGNIRFARIVDTYREEYQATSNRRTKDTIARHAIQQVRRNQGQFLRRVESAVELSRLGIPVDGKCFVPADEEGVLLKTKQSLRDKDHPSAHTKVKATGVKPVVQPLLGDHSAANPESRLRESRNAPFESGGHKRPRVSDPSIRPVGMQAVATERAASMTAAAASDSRVGQLLTSFLMRQTQPPPPPPPPPPPSSVPPPQESLHPLALLRRQFQREQLTALLQQRQLEQEQLENLRRFQVLRAARDDIELNRARTLAELESLLPCNQTTPLAAAHHLINSAVSQNPQWSGQLLNPPRRPASANDILGAFSLTESAQLPPPLDRAETEPLFLYPTSHAATQARKRTLQKQQEGQRQEQQHQLNLQLQFQQQFGQQRIPPQMRQQQPLPPRLQGLDTMSALLHRPELSTTDPSLLRLALQLEAQRVVPFQHPTHMHHPQRAGDTNRTPSMTASLLAALQADEQQTQWNASLDSSLASSRVRTAPFLATNLPIGSPSNTGTALGLLPTTVGGYTFPPPYGNSVIHAAPLAPEPPNNPDQNAQGEEETKADLSLQGQGRSGENKLQENREQIE